MKINKCGFTLIELLIYISIFAIAAGMLSGILVVFTRIQSQEAASAEVTQQLSFVQTTIQRLVRESVNIENPAGVASSTLILRMASSSLDRTKIFADSNAIYLQQGDIGPINPLTSDRVKVSQFEVVKYENPGGHAIVQVDLSLTYNSQRVYQQITRNLKTSIGRVTAATFDDNLQPNKPDWWSIGNLSFKWKDLYLSNLLYLGNLLDDPVGVLQNGAIYYNASSSVFRGYKAGEWQNLGEGFWTASGNNISNTNTGNVGIGTTGPLEKLQVAGSGIFDTNLNIRQNLWADKILESSNPQFMNVPNSLGGRSKGDTWTEAGTDALPVATAAHSSLVYDGKIWVIGGYTGSGPVRKVYYSTNGSTWTEAGTDALPVATRSHSSLVYDGKMWVIGGYNIGGSPIREVYYSTNGSTWTKAGTNALPVATFQLSSLVYDGKMWVIGGYTPGVILVRKVYYTSPTIKGGLIVTDSIDFELFRITNTGNVGIGTVSPAVTLDVNGQISATASGIGFNGNANGYGMTLSGNTLRLTASEGLQFRTYTDGSYNTKMTILQNGNVGIGTTGPAQKLSVVGVIESSTGGFKFPDGTTQTTAASGGGALEYYQVEGNTDIQTTSAVFEDMSDMLLSVTGAGTYFAIFSANLGSSGAANDGDIELQVDGVTKRKGMIIPYSSQEGNNLIWTGVLGVGSHVFKIRWKANGGTMYQRGTRGERVLVVTRQP